MKLEWRPAPEGTTVAVEFLEFGSSRVHPECQVVGVAPDRIAVVVRGRHEFLLSGKESPRTRHKYYKRTVNSADVQRIIAAVFSEEKKP